MYRDSMRHLQERGLFLPIRDSVTSQKKVLRICLGYHNHSSGLRPRARMKIALDCAAGVGVVICESHSLCKIDCAVEQGPADDQAVKARHRSELFNVFESFDSSA